MYRSATSKREGGAKVVRRRPSGCRISIWAPSRSKINRDGAQKLRARPETGSAPRSASIRRAQPFWVQNFHLGAIEVENQQGPRREATSAPRSRHSPAEPPPAAPLLTTACARHGAHGVDGDPSASEPSRSGAAASRASPLTGPVDGLAPGPSATPATPTTALACRRLRLRTLLMSEFHPREPPPSQVSWGAVVALWQ
jgi:hypothetical protein